MTVVVLALAAAVVWPCGLAFFARDISRWHNHHDIEFPACPGWTTNDILTTHAQIEALPTTETVTHA